MVWEVRLHHILEDFDGGKNKLALKRVNFNAGQLRHSQIIYQHYRDLRSPESPLATRLMLLKLLVESAGQCEATDERDLILRSGRALLLSR
jgi:hypothetical protein